MVTVVWSKHLGPRFFGLLHGPTPHTAWPRIKIVIVLKLTDWVCQDHNGLLQLLRMSLNDWKKLWKGHLWEVCMQVEAVIWLRSENGSWFELTSVDFWFLVTFDMHWLFIFIDFLFSSTFHDFFWLWSFVDKLTYDVCMPVGAEIGLRVEASHDAPLSTSSSPQPCAHQSAALFAFFALDVALPQ